MNWEIELAIALVCVIVGVLVSGFVKGGAAKAKSGASSLLDEAKAAGNNVVHDVEAAAHSIGDLLHHPAPAAPEPAPEPAPALAAAVDPNAAHAALDAAIANAQAQIDQAKAAKDLLSRAQDALAGAVANAGAVAKP